MKKIIYLLIVIIAALSALVLFLIFRPVKNPPAPNDQTPEKNIEVYNLTPNQTVASPLTITGRAKGWYFEASFPVKIVDDNGKILAQGPATAQGEWMTADFVDFKITLEFFPNGATQGKVIFQKDNPSGLPQYDESYEIPVIFAPVETMTVKIYFPNNIKDPGLLDCAHMYPVKRTIAKTAAVARAALEELLKGPTEEEKTAGYLTSINSGVKIQKLAIENGVARVDFDEQLEYQVGGSCRVAAIGAEITETLKQFPAVKSVIISVNGRTEDILQP